MNNFIGFPDEYLFAVRWLKPVTAVHVLYSILNQQSMLVSFDDEDELPQTLSGYLNLTRPWPADQKYKVHEYKHISIKIYT